MGTKKNHKRLLHKRPDRIVRIPRELHSVLSAFCFQYSLKSVDDLVIDLLSSVAIRHHKNITDNLPAQQDLISKVVNGKFHQISGSGV